MKKPLTLLSLLLAGATLSMSAQSEASDSKLDGALQSLLQQQRHSRATGVQQMNYGPRSFRVDEALSLLVLTNQPEKLVAFVKAAGYHANYIVDQLVVVNAPISFVPQLNARPDVLQVDLSQQHGLFMKEARKVSNVDVIHKGGFGLKTPFKGKGVVIGVIDQGFQYRHPAFLKADGTTRVRAMWNRYNQATKTQPLLGENIPDDGEATGSHATHVTGIAAGSDVGNGFYGVAPEADIIMIPSTFKDGDILEEVKYIKKFAEDEGKPWVINMSFGSNIGPHDGMTMTDRAISRLTGKGGIIAAAMGNERELHLHTSGSVAPSEDKYIFVEADRDPANEWIILDLWGQATDRKFHFNITPVVLSKNKVEEKDVNYLRSVGSTYNRQINSVSGKEQHFFQFNIKTLRETLGDNNAKFGVKLVLTRNEKKTHDIHGWTNDRAGTISTEAPLSHQTKTLLGDNKYQVGNGAASIPTAIAVASYNSTVSFTSYTAKGTFHVGVGTESDVSNFSNLGPFLNDKYPKPSIAAPGAIISSAFNSFASDFDPKDNLITDVYSKGNKDYYYGAMQGTSMATPFVSGVIALWLEANPNLSYDDIIEIFKKTALRDEFFKKNVLNTSDQQWSASFGYGKIDAYVGLKEVLKLPNAIERVSNSAAPVTIAMHSDSWSILFNNAERFANVRIVDMAGKTVAQHQFAALQQGEERLIDFKQLPAGTYLLNIQTAGSHTTHRVLVQ